MGDFVLEVVRMRVQEDRINKANDEAIEGDLQHWKRVIVKFKGTDDRGPIALEARLDMRARLLTFTSEGAVTPVRQLAETIVNHLATFAFQPRSELFVERPDPARNGAEWIVADAVHTSGLLHRLSEAGKLNRLRQPQLPLSLRDAAKALLQDIKGNLAAMDIWMDHAVNKGNPVYHLAFHASMWDMYGPRLMATIPSKEVRTDLTTFFEGSRQFAIHVARALDHWQHRPTPRHVKADSAVASTWAFFTTHGSTIVDAGNRLRVWFEKVDGEVQ